MNRKKALALAAFLMGIIALGGALFALTMLFEISSLIGGIGATPDGAFIAPMMGFFSSFLIFGWIWSICVIIAAAYAIYASYKTLREK
jgi:hypothetical protein